jgi:hypothetical protein
MRYLLLIPIICLQGCFFLGRITPDGKGGYVGRGFGLGSVKTKDGAEVKSELINLDGFMVKDR